MQSIVKKWLTRFFEHGILVAFLSVANHWEAMNTARGLRANHVESIAHSAVQVNLMFEYWVLAFGLSIALVAFVGECIVARRRLGR